MLTVLQLSDTIMATLWAMLRVSGLVLVAPILGAVFVPARVRVLIAAVLAVAMLPVIAEQPAYSPLSGQGMLTIAQEIIGLS
jgi:flagellar biosynthetic protein FliR